MKQKYELEYNLNSSPKVLFTRLSTPEGLAEWFADDVQVDGDIFTFVWDDTEYRAQLALLRDNRQVKFKWLDTDDPEEKYFEFRLNIDELTGEVALLITDFTDPDEKDDATYLWDTQIAELKKVLGL